MAERRPPPSGRLVRRRVKVFLAGRASRATLGLEGRISAPVSGWQNPRSAYQQQSKEASLGVVSNLGWPLNLYHEQTNKRTKHSIAAFVCLMFRRARCVCASFCELKEGYPKNCSLLSRNAPSQILCEIPRPET